MPAIEKWTPGLLDEVRGIAEGAERFRGLNQVRLARQRIEREIERL